MVGMPRSHVLSLWTLVFCLGLAVGMAAPQSAPTGPARLAVTEATLDNGLRVLIQEDPRNPIVAVQIFYRVGSRNELPGATGLAHFLEHMMFKGTPTRGRGEISRLIELNGGRDNAFTTKDMTGYHVNIAADRLDLVLDHRGRSHAEPPARPGRDRLGAQGRHGGAPEPDRRRSGGRGLRGDELDGVPGASVPLADHRVDVGHRADQPGRAARLLRHLLPAEQRDPGDRGRREGPRRARARAPALRPDPARARTPPR